MEEVMFSPPRPRSFVCVSVCVQDYSKKACMDLDEMLRVDRCRDMDNWLTFEPDPDYSPDAGTGLLSPIAYALQLGILLYVGKLRIVRASQQRRVVLSRMHCDVELRRENPTYWYWAPVEAATRGFEASEHHCRR